MNSVFLVAFEQRQFVVGGYPDSAPSASTDFLWLGAQAKLAGIVGCVKAPLWKLTNRSWDYDGVATFAFGFS
ncbi:MAG: hypothetical protein FJ403_14215 [Verrucomicrobia bacterium]|nr:hypothetical protein [Verrucomicrobiota bacterium]